MPVKYSSLNGLQAVNPTGADDPLGVAAMQHAAAQNQSNYLSTMKENLVNPGYHAGPLPNLQWDAMLQGLHDAGGHATGLGMLGNDMNKPRPRSTSTYTPTVQGMPPVVA